MHYTTYWLYNILTYGILFIYIYTALPGSVQVHDISWPAIDSRLANANAAYALKAHDISWHQSNTDNMPNGNIIYL
jgi:hypothetical protein